MNVVGHNDPLSASLDAVNEDYDLRSTVLRTAIC